MIFKVCLRLPVDLSVSFACSLGLKGPLKYSQEYFVLTVTHSDDMAGLQWLL